MTTVAYKNALYNYKLGLALATAASSMLPGARIAAVSALEVQCDPGAIEKGAREWLEVGKRYWNLAGSISKKSDKLDKAKWEGGDREAFEEKLNEFVTALRSAAATAFLIGTSLFVLATVLFLASFFVAAVGLLLAALAVIAFYPPARPAAQAMAMAVSLDLRVLVFDLRPVVESIAAILGALGGTNFVFQLAFSPGDALVDLVQSTLYSIDEIAIAYVENAVAGGPGLGKVGVLAGRVGPLGGRFWAGIGYQTGDTIRFDGDWTPSIGYSDKSTTPSGWFPNPVDPGAEIPEV